MEKHFLPMPASIKSLLLVISILVLGLAGCTSDSVFESYSEIPNARWDYNNRASFDIAIKDTSIKYNVYVNVRHSNDYAYRNLWVYMHTTYPSGKKLQTRVDLPLADKLGKWFGKGMSDIITTQVMIQQNALLPEKGDYHFEIEQHMRENPLPKIMDVGMRVEVAK